MTERTSVVGLEPAFDSREPRSGNVTRAEPAEQRQRAAREARRVGAWERRQEARKSFIREATRVLASTLDAERAVTMVAELAVPHIADWCAVDLLDDSGVVRRIAVAHVDPEKVKLAHELVRRYPPDPASTRGVPQVLRSGVSELVSPIPDELLVAVARDSEHLAIVRQLGLQSYMVVPIRTSTRTFGAVSFVTAEAKRRLTPDDLSLAEQLCDCAAIALKNARLYREAQQARVEAEEATSHWTTTATRMEILSDASRIFAEKSIDVDELTSSVATLVGTRLGDSCAVLLVAPDSRTLIPKALYEVEPQAEASMRRLLERVPSRVGEGIAGRVVESGRSVHVPAAQREDFVASVQPEHRACLDSVESLSVLGVPLRARGVVIGVVLAWRHRARAGYSLADKRLLEALADHAGLAIDNARLLEAERLARATAEAARVETAMLYRLAHATNRALTLEEVYEAALDAIRGTLGVERAAILLLDAGKVMRFETWRGLSAEYRAAVEGHSPWRTDDASPQALFVEDVRRSPELSAYLSVLADEDIAALAFVPLVYESRLLGKFMLYGPAPRQFSPREVGIAKSIADQLASAVGRRRAAQDRERLIEQLTETLRLNELFAGILGHDLRNPLGAILTAAEVARTRSDDEEVRRPIARILSSGWRMTRMIEQLLDFTRARVGGGLAVEGQPMDLAALCRQIVGEFEDANPRSAVRLELVGDARGVWDADRIAQAISNVVGNACQHRLPGTPVRVMVDGSRPAEVLLRVSNRGEIEPELMPVLFDPFRGPQQRRERNEGLGLGLFITQQIIVAHGGSLQVSTQAGEVAFTVRVPRVARSPKGRC